MQYEDLVSLTQKQLELIGSLTDTVRRLADMQEELRWRVRFLESALEEFSCDLGDPLEDTDHAA
ncbi:hypothetical protein [Aromatoleum buckelii]|uniref:Uncharacterized protein n=1 Tax=Aromatoleum buckelii TaxID=200254 RepID=A0ABX1N897_9RHOO|nr:hypothetical protein [Aromatoleum buckelii]